ncbi:hypothetical protein TE10_17735 [Raoultella ornithinolytica]|uniref:Rhs element Vgr protein n=1 Tax=Raoultella terrigena TaxID=577 RepID=A0A7Z8Z8U3_RAOTE|nr:hypothetical protein TE10_17735 [Raoultella ornithinolytica]VED48987.1 Rhs element Vgr protein [Raoultella terrigena]
MNAGGDFSCGALGNTAVLAGEQIGLFALSGSLTLNASEGPLQIQEQSEAMNIIAEQKLSLVSASDINFLIYSGVIFCRVIFQLNNLVSFQKMRLCIRYFYL